MLLLIGFLLAIYLLFFQSCFSAKEPPKIRAGICGAVTQPAVYTLPEGSDLATLIVKAKGLRHDADIRSIDIGTTVLNDTIYHIPSIGSAKKGVVAEILKSYQEAFSYSVSQGKLKPMTYPSKPDELNSLNILYIGLPAVYIIINYYPELKRISFTHIPHSTVLLANHYRVIDLFFTLGILPTRQIIQRQLQTRIDHYIVQDKYSFIEMIDLLDGVDINLDEPYATAYDLTPGQHRINGFYTWEYIRFLDFKRIKRTYKGYSQQDLTRVDVFDVEPNQWANAFEMRNQRQRYVINAMRRSFDQLAFNKQAILLKRVQSTIDTDMGVSLITDLYRDMLSVKDFTYGRINGKFISEGNNLYFYPDVPSFKASVKREVRQLIDQKRPTQVAY